MTNLFAKETVFISEALTQNDVFVEVAQALLEHGLVTEEFLSNLVEREKQYPTGLPLAPIDERLPNVAIPHTESSFVNQTRIVPVKLKHPLIFHNMIVPDEELQVSFLFMILNHDESEQSGLLAQIMDFVNRQNVEDLVEFFSFESVEEVYHYLEKNF
ncbi:PTS sugar transporter subunit IIA [Streptococcus sp. NLN76]|uniref:PTS sugar transporter subunit IIA n=1 Tax=Streptococcus sp. NLN76 TaxID=2822800 RepID=UPI0018AB490A|nr:PTS sugar transporter subunit IIA [Streptococcus sp. NLN76]MBF8969629.1 PTS sugar transporter subunit IIA [Streptococcus sp. NLN76]